MSQVAHQAPGGSQSNTNGPSQTSEGPTGHYGTPGRRVTFVGSALHRGNRQSSFGSLDQGAMGDSMVFGSHSNGLGFVDDLLSSHHRLDPRGDVDSTTAVLDAAILDLTRRRLAIAPHPGGDQEGVGCRESTWDRRSVSYARSASSLAARQRQLRQQQMELEQRQRELEVQRQQLLAGMQEHAKSSSHLAAQENSHSMSVPTSQQQWWVCQVCNSRAFACHDDAMEHEISCCPDLNKYETMASAMPIPSDHHITGLSGYPISPCDLDSGLEAMPSDCFAMMKEPMPLAMSSDKDWLTPLHCFVRRHCVEVFTASHVDISTPSKGKRKPVQVGQVGIRCPHCHKAEASGKTRERGSVYYPTSIASIYNATMNLLQRHLHNCAAVPADIMRQFETLKGDDARSGTSKRYWIESAMTLGLVDTINGICYSSLSPPPLPRLSSEQHATGSFSAERRNSNDFFSSNSNALADLNHRESPVDKVDPPQLDRPPDVVVAAATGDESCTPEQSLADSAPLVIPEDEPYSTKFSFQLISQMQPCVFTEADRLGKRKGLPAGFPGLACRHCFGGYGSGRFFPSSIKTLSDTSKTLNVLHNHMMRCRKCPQEVRETLEKLRGSHDEERGQMKFGSQKAFFARVWEKLHKNGKFSSTLKRKAAASPPVEYPYEGHAMQNHSYMDSRYFGPPITPPFGDNFPGHNSFSMLDSHPLDISDHKRRRSG